MPDGCGVVKQANKELIIGWPLARKGHAAMGGFLLVVRSEDERAPTRLVGSPIGAMGFAHLHAVVRRVIGSSVCIWTSELSNETLARSH